MDEDTFTSDLRAILSISPSMHVKIVAKRISGTNWGQPLISLVNQWLFPIRPREGERWSRLSISHSQQTICEAAPPFSANLSRRQIPGLCA